jgi:hypothetical protein
VDQAQGLDLSQNFIDVVVEDETTGRPWKLAHHLRVPTDAEWIHYQRQATAVRFIDNKTVETGDAVEAQVALWDACIERVDDKYLWEQQRVMAQEDWKKKIPARHKVMAIRQIIGVRAQVVDGPLA